MSMASKNHKIIVEPDGSGGRRVTPGLTLVKPTDTVAFYNHTEGEIHIQFSMFSVFHEMQLDVAADAKSQLTVHNPHDVVMCSFAVFCDDINNFAHGSAMPIIIVDPKS